MPVLKQQQATPKLKDAIVLDLDDVGRQAQRIREQAQRDAERITQEAEQRAQQLIDGAEEKGQQQGYDAGYAQGLEKGREQGRAEALEQMQKQLQELSDAWTNAAQQWQQQCDQLEREAQHGVVELAVKVAQKLVHRTVEVDESVVVDQVAGALSHVLRPLDVSVRIHPDDRPVLEQAMPQLSERFSHLPRINLADDAALDRGGCVVSFGQGEVDASLDTQLTRIVHALLPDNRESTDDANNDQP